jgi:SAM-dependent methyltransferase
VSYHATVQEIYREAARTPDRSLCCVPQPPLFMPGLKIPSIMHEMNYGCGTTVHLRDMQEGQRVLYVGVGGGLEALQFAYFTRRPGGVIAIDPVAEMRQAARDNLEQACCVNDWLDPSFVEVRDGDALDLPVDDESIDLAAQNCLFNIFETATPGAANGKARGDLERALGEMHRVLTRGGRLSMSDPVAARTIPAHLRRDETLRAQCISGCLTYGRYLDKIVEAGFGSAEVRSRRPYRLLDRERYGLDESLLLESVEVCAIKVPVPADGPCVFTGRTAIYTGIEATFDDHKGHVLARDLPFPVCDKTAEALAGLERPDLTVTESTWHYAGGGCC